MHQSLNGLDHSEAGLYPDNRYCGIDIHFTGKSLQFYRRIGKIEGKSNLPRDQQTAYSIFLSAAPVPVSF